MTTTSEADRSGCRLPINDPIDDDPLHHSVKSAEDRSGSQGSCKPYDWRHEPAQLPIACQGSHALSPDQKTDRSFCGSKRALRQSRSAQSTLGAQRGWSRTPLQSEVCWRFWRYQRFPALSTGWRSTRPSLPSGRRNSQHAQPLSSEARAPKKMTGTRLLHESHRACSSFSALGAHYSSGKQAGARDSLLPA